MEEVGAGLGQRETGKSREVEGRFAGVTGWHADGWDAEEGGQLRWKGAA